MGLGKDNYSWKRWFLYKKMVFRRENGAKERIWPKKRCCPIMKMGKWVRCLRMGWVQGKDVPWGEDWVK
jgi:hypothetical protein